jgi:2-succinyl-5-enolpyruvyl-6-hydroxy-3-cyclohexene-1-carboxylate synthase
VGEPGFGDAIERVVVFGHPTLSREVPALIQRVETIVVRTPGVEGYNPGHAVATFVDGVEATGDVSQSKAWVGRWVTASRKLLEQHDAPDIEIATADDPKSQAAFGRAVLAGLRAPVTRRALVESVWRVTWPHDRLVFGASRLIREADQVVPGKKISVHANRGLAGIDGTISTAIGIALAAGGTGVTRVLLGDLAALHDAGGMLFGAGEERPRIQVIIGNDRGGTLFDSLEVAASADQTAFERVLLTPQQIDFASLAAAYGWEYRHVATRGELEEALAASTSPTLIEVPLPR